MTDAAIDKPSEAGGARSALASLWKTVPLPVLLLVGTVVGALFLYDSAEQVVGRINEGFGLAVGDFALLILPAFVISSALAALKVRSSERLGTGMAPFLGGAMICPDTAYATLAPFAGRRNLATAYGAYTGFKLLYPAGPLIIAAGMGVAFDWHMLLFGGLVFVPVWIAGLAWARLTNPPPLPDGPETAAAADDRSALQASMPVFACLGLLLALIVAGLVFSVENTIGSYFLSAHGALLVSALLALWFVRDPEQIRAVLERAVRFTAGLIFVIGIASAMGAVLVDAVGLDMVLAGDPHGIALILVAFLTAVFFKAVQGSSMATFAAVAPIVAVMGPDLGAANAALVVYAVCVGSMVAILPNDSFFWLVRGNAYAGEQRDFVPIRDLAIGSSLQAVVGLAVVLALAILV
ncbi:MAG: hypothetical protein RID91_15615 [Azospirillaceae bacterium]